METGQNRTEQNRTSETLLCVIGLSRRVVSQFTCNHLSEHPFNLNYNILVYKSQQDAQVTDFILSDNCSTCFRGHYHPSSGAQNNCNYSMW